MDTETSFKNVCRTCLTSQMFETSTFQEISYFNDSLGVILYKCCAIEPDVSGMPNVICNECKNQLLTFYKFRKQCEDSDAVLRTYIKNNISVFLKESSNDCNDNHEFIENTEIKEHNIIPDIDEIIEDELENPKDEIKIENTSKKVRAINKQNNTCKTCKLQKCKCKLKPLIKLSNNVTISFVSKKEKKVLKQTDISNETKEVENKTEPVEIHLDEKVEETTELIEKHPLISKLQKIHECPICQETFVRKTYLESHVLTHDSALPFTCKECGKFFPKYRNLLIHEKVHTGQRPYSCTTCGKSFALSGNLKTHIRIHTGYKPYSCQHCGKTFAQWSSLRSHLVCHTGDRSYICAVCGKSFTRGGILARHMTSHSDEKNYECNICKKRFKNSSQRGRHMVTHTDIKKYKCSYCGKCFNRASNLKVHEMIHSGSRPHSCPVCGKGFIQLHCLRSHMNTHC